MLQSHAGSPRLERQDGVRHPYIAKDCQSNISAPAACSAPWYMPHREKIGNRVEASQGTTQPLEQDYQDCPCAYFPAGFYSRIWTGTLQLMTPAGGLEYNAAIYTPLGCR